MGDIATLGQTNASGDRLFRTDDGGARSQPLLANVQIVAGALDFASATTCWIVDVSAPSHPEDDLGRNHKACDGGRSWVSLSSLSTTGQ
jgi:hypothetical protein